MMSSMKSITKMLLVLLITGFSFVASANTEISERLRSEFDRLVELVSTLEPDDHVGYLESKSYGDHELLWKLGETSEDNDVIRIYYDKGEKEQAFTISYHRSRHIVEGRTVIRRFVGPMISGWRNDTIDADTGAYLGSQGAITPRLDDREKEIMEEWDIQLFED